MRGFQNSFFLGSVQLKITGENPVYFLETCSRNGIRIWDVSRPALDTCIAKMSLEDLPTMKKLRYRSGYKVSFEKKSGLPFLKKNFFRRRALVIGLMISLVLFLLLSNMIWQVRVSGVPEEIESRIYTELDNYGIKTGAFKWTIPPPNDIQQFLMEDVPELLWVGVNLQGTTYHLEGIEKRIVKREEAGNPQHLVANKNGVIQNLFVKKGQPEVKVNEFVEKGQILVSGEIEKQGSSNTQDEETTYERIRAEGEVRAITWYHVETTMPLETMTERLTGKMTRGYKVQLGSLTIPLWPWRKDDFEQVFEEQERKKFSLYNWEIPVQFIINHRYEASTERKAMTKEEAIEAGVEQAKADLLLELEKDAEILSGKILHETIERGKVNLSLYITVEENIATGQPINQGD